LNDERHSERWGHGLENTVNYYLLLELAYSNRHSILQSCHNTDAEIGQKIRRKKIKNAKK